MQFHVICLSLCAFNLLLDVTGCLYKKETQVLTRKVKDQKPRSIKLKGSIKTNYNNYGEFEATLKTNPKECKNELEYLIFDSGRTAIKDVNRRWPNGVVPYQFYTGPDLNQMYIPGIKRVILQTLGWIEKRSNVRFEYKTSLHTDYVTIKAGTPKSNIGRIGGEQFMYLGSKGCIRRRTIFHETFHILGLIHEQSRPDRDYHVKILQANIIPGMENNFKKVAIQNVEMFGLPYDLKSVMHYKGAHLSSNGRNTIETINPKYQSIIGQEKPSAQDYQRINLMYPAIPKAASTNPNLQTTTKIILTTSSHKKQQQTK